MRRRSKPSPDSLNAACFEGKCLIKKTKMVVLPDGRCVCSDVKSCPDMETFARSVLGQSSTSTPKPESR